MRHVACTQTDMFSWPRAIVGLGSPERVVEHAESQKISLVVGVIRATEEKLSSCKSLGHG